MKPGASRLACGFGLSVSDPKVQEGWKKLLNSGGAPNPQVSQGEIKGKPAVPQLLVTEEGPQAANCKAGPRTGQP